MCFYNGDCDWTASVCEQADTVAIADCKCSECGQTIPVGAFAHTIFMQEYEECRACEETECECPYDSDGNPICWTKGCQCEKPELGETFDYVRCDGCDKFLQAVESAEIAEGCDRLEARPNLPMYDDMQGIGQEECKKYWIKAVEMFPEFKRHFGMLWKRIF